MENHQFYWDNSLWIAMFNSYLKLPEGIWLMYGWYMADISLIYGWYMIYGWCLICGIYDIWLICGQCRVNIWIIRDILWPYPEQWIHNKGWIPPPLFNQHTIVAPEPFEMVAEKQHVVDVLVDFFDDEFVDFFELKMIVKCFFHIFQQY